jgi:Ser/Thr protein kinase RdoA (MazF antagonist)
MTSTPNGKPIAVGRTAEIYAWDDGTVLKLFRSWMPASAANDEARIARTVHATGIRVPAVGDVITVGGRTGILYERVEGMPMMDAMLSRLWRLRHFARLLAGLHAEMHGESAPGLPSQKQRLIDKIESAASLPATLRVRALDALDEMPDGDRLCHGDFHPDNILMTTEGPIIIDWVDATQGHPMADVARTSLLLSSGSLPPKIPGPVRWLLSAVRRRFHDLYLQHYLHLRPDDQQVLEAWPPLIAAARLSENIAEEQTLLVAKVKAGLS